jgi:2,4-dienoyl-CoA reductase-like NADH-dependent reductase (Old Yellow Enzyme family)
MLTQKQIDAWTPVVKAIQAEGAVAVMQMFHCGRMAWPEVNPANRVIAPSPMAVRQINPVTGTSYPIPSAMSWFDIDHVINGFVETAKGGVVAGFDGIEIQGAHGYLISQFLSSYSNQRTDRYGGSVENRYFFIHRIINAVRSAIPEDVLLFVRISDWGVADMEVSLFGSREEFQEIIGYLSNEPIDAVSVSTYDYSQKAFGTDRTMARLAREITDLPIMICGAVHDRATAEDALKDADIVLSGKSLLLNPDWVKDIRENKRLNRYKSSEAGIAYTPEPLP